MDAEMQFLNLRRFLSDRLSDGTMMESMFDIFSRLPDGSPLWIESVEGLEEAKKRLSRLARYRPGRYFIYSEERGEVVGRVPEP